MRRFLVPLWLALALVSGSLLAAVVHSATCWPSDTPVGAQAPAQPMWCMTPGGDGPSTFTQGPNSWVDQFQHGLDDAPGLGAGYQVFENSGASTFQSMHFRHNNHWMVDLNGYDQNGPNGPYYNFGGSTMRPDRSFHFENGVLVVEADVAAGVDAYGGDAWPEIAVSMAPAPTGNMVDNLYSYGIFGGYWTLGCRLHAQRGPICAMYDNTGRSVFDGGRVIEISFFQDGGAAQTYGGYPGTPELDAAWRVCQGTDPDTNCRDRFRWELRKDSLTLYVNGVRYMQHSGFPPDAQIPDEMLNGEVYTYFSDWIFKPDQSAFRYHWSRVAVNPGTPPSAAPGYGGIASSASSGSSHYSAAAPSPSAAATPAQPPVRSSVRAGVGPLDGSPFGYTHHLIQPTLLVGQFPLGLIDWGVNTWYQSGPYPPMVNKSVSFRAPATGTGSFALVTAARRLVQLRATNLGKTPGILSLACAGQPKRTTTLAPGQSQLVVTGWTGSCSRVYVGATNGWDTILDSVVAL